MTRESAEGAIAYVGLGTNVGDRVHNLVIAMRMIAAEPDIQVLEVSSIYETEPVGMTGSSLFLNAVCSIHTRLDPETLVKLLEGIETEMGRTAKGELKSRIIDLDLLLQRGCELEVEGLRVPHPRLHERRFVLVPLHEIAPSAFHPVLGKTIDDILLDLGEGDGVRFYSRFPKEEFMEG
jgi:2-amino-4-hydroxy-6-hydroxymethyldihydropteridine diphosphokinase